jgi:hypothetical protein
MIKALLLSLSELKKNVRSWVFLPINNLTCKPNTKTISQKIKIFVNKNFAHRPFLL